MPQQQSQQHTLNSPIPQQEKPTETQKNNVQTELGMCTSCSKKILDENDIGAEYKHQYYCKDCANQNFIGSCKKCNKPVYNLNIGGSFYSRMEDLLILR